MPPCVVVMNNGMVQREQEGLRVLETNAITRLLLEDCIPYIQSPLPGAHRQVEPGMAGLSMGSMQTSMVTLGHPDLFGYAGVFSGFVGALKIGQSMPDQSYLKELDDKEKFQQDFKVFFPRLRRHGLYCPGPL